VADAQSSKFALEYAASGKTGSSQRATGQMMSSTTAAPPMSGIRGSIAASLSNSIASSAKIEYPIKESLREVAAAAHPAHRMSAQDGQETELRTIAPVLAYGDTASKDATSATTPSNKVLRGTVGKSTGYRPEELEGGTEMTDHEMLVAECRKRIDGYPNASEGFSGVLMKKPRGFTKVRIRGISWQTRYFVLDNHPTNPLRYSHENQKTKFVTVPLQYVSDIYRVGQDELHLTMDTHRDDTSTIKLRLKPGTPPDVMQRWFDQIVVKIDDLGHAAPPAALLAGEMEEDEHGEHGPWYKMPEHASTFSQVVFVMTWPVKALVFLTTPNVLDKRYAKYYVLTIVISAIWLAVFAILMTDVIEYFGCGIQVDSTVMGLSLGAIGTSFPNLYASILVAKSGQGGMAICQAIASNTFNVCICLGLLWVIHTIGLGTCDYGSHGFLGGHSTCGGCYAPSGFEPLCPFWEGTNNQYGLSSGSTKGAVLYSFFWMVFFVGVLVICRMRVGKVPSIIMFSAYIIYIIYQFAAAFGNFALCIRFVNICF
jgi:Ca2+/Na+ antiporter